MTSARGYSSGSEEKKQLMDHCNHGSLTHRKKTNTAISICLVVEPYPSEKDSIEFVKWDDDIFLIWKNKIHVPTIPN